MIWVNAPYGRERDNVTMLNRLTKEEFLEEANRYRAEAAKLRGLSAEAAAPEARRAYLRRALDCEFLAYEMEQEAGPQ